jgi:hypothetical protein
MSTQSIKCWLNKLFAWWPWRNHPETSYAQAVNNANQSTSQEPTWRTRVGGTVAQPGITSVAVEHGNNEAGLEGDRQALDKQPEAISQPYQQIGEEKSTISPSPSTAQEITTSANNNAPTEEQHLAFLRYLVQRGLLNEGFEDGQIPEQYQRYRAKCR